MPSVRWPSGPATEPGPAAGVPPAGKAVRASLGDGSRRSASPWRRRPSQARRARAALDCLCRLERGELRADDSASGSDDRGSLRLVASGADHRLWPPLRAGAAALCPGAPDTASPGSHRVHTAPHRPVTDSPRRSCGPPGRAGCAGAAGHRQSQAPAADRARAAVPESPSAGWGMGSGPAPPPGRGPGTGWRPRGRGAHGVGASTPGGPIQADG
jgi:hypothetical protein